jgi:hypothetical protein
MPNPIFAPLASRIFAATPLAGARVYIYEDGTTTQVSLTDENGDALAQPLTTGSDGSFVTPYVAGTDLVTIYVTDSTGAALPGYPINNVPPASLGGLIASSVSYTPSGSVPATNVQAAIEAVAAQAAAPSTALIRSDTLWPTGGTGDAFTITPSPAITAYETGQAFRILPNRANSGAATININALGIRDIRRMNASSVATALGANELLPGRPVEITYDGTRFVVTDEHPLYISNANGTAVRFSDGTQIAWRAVTPDFTGTSPYSYDYPVAFTSIPACHWSASRSTTITAGADLGVLRDLWVQGATSTWVLHFVSNGSASSAFATIQLTAMGRWK